MRWNVPRVLVPLLAAQCGWSMFVTMATPMAYAVLWSWSHARDRAGDPRSRLIGWAAFTTVNLTLLSWVVLLLSL
jgi:hypothetical protein